MGENLNKLSIKGIGSHGGRSSENPRLEESFSAEEDDDCFKNYENENIVIE